MLTNYDGVNENKGDFCKECRIKTEEIYEVKEELIRTQLKYENLMAKYSKLSHEKEVRLTSNTYEDCKATFSQSQWNKAFILKDKHSNMEMNNLKQKQKAQEEIIQRLTSLKEKSQRKYQQILEKQEKQLKTLRLFNEESQDKVNQKNKICKVMMAKIFSLETEVNSLKQEAISLKKTEEKQKQEGKQWKDEGIQASLYDKGSAFNSFIQDQLRDQLVYQFFEIFLKSFDITRNQPSLEIFRLNLNLIDLARLQPYCKCFNKFLELQSNELPADTEVTQKEKWILESFSYLKVQNDNQADNDSKLVFLFRLSSLFYRIRNPMQGGQKMAGQKVLKRMKNELYNAFYNYLF